MEVAASAIAVIQLSMEVCSLCGQYATAVKNARQDIARLQKEVEALQSIAEGVRKLLDSFDGTSLRTSQDLSQAVRESRAQLMDVRDKLDQGPTPSKARQLIFRTLKWPFQGPKLEKTISDLRQSAQTMNAAVAIDQTAILLEIDKRSVLSQLPVAADAAYDSHAEGSKPKCLPTTRVEILEAIDKWVTDPDGKAIFWLSGMAGTGKSTISRTVAHEYSQSHLGASFFFKRGEGDRGNVSKFFTTIAADLVIKRPTVARHVKSAIEKDSAILRKMLRAQLSALVIDPLAATSLTPEAGSCVLLVIDALDECEPESDIKLIINLLCHSRHTIGPQLRVLLTSRPELPIRLGFNIHEGRYHNLVLHEIPSPTIERDIRTFLQHRLAHIMSEYNITVDNERHLPMNWPGESNIQSLVQMASPLFIFASTVCLFLADRRCGNPRYLLEKVLAFKTTAPQSKLQATYMPVLDQQIAGLDKKESDLVIRDFRLVVGSIVLFWIPLPVETICRLLDVPRYIVDNRLDMLHSVLSIPSAAATASPVRILHLSFRDFLVDDQRREENPFWVDEGETHACLAAHCLRVMENLKENSCCLPDPAARRDKVDVRAIDKNISRDLQYACEHWVHHLKEARLSLIDIEKINYFLQKHFLHWLEALSLLGRARESIAYLRMIKATVVGSCPSYLSEFLDHALDFVLSNIYCVDTYPLQLYFLVLFSPLNSHVRSNYLKSVPNWLQFWSNLNTKHNTCLYLIEDDRYPAQTVAFSHDSALLASGSYRGSVAIWSTHSRSMLQTLCIDRTQVHSLVFSHNSQLIAAAVGIDKIYIWHLESGNCVQTLERPNAIPREYLDCSIQFSHDSTLLAAVAIDEIWLWNIDSGKRTKTLESPAKICFVAFSHDSALLASCLGKRILIWHASSGELFRTLQGGHESTIIALAFSSDSSLIYSACYNTICVWSTVSGQCVRKFRDASGHRAGQGTFSADAALFASRGLDTIYIRSTMSGDLVQKLEGHRSIVTGMAFSHDSSLFASSSHDMTVRVWSVEHYQTRSILQPPNYTEARRSKVILSPNTKQVAFTNGDGTTQIWDTESGRCTQTLIGHTDQVLSWTFSEDSSLLYSGSADKTIRIWNVSNGDQIHVLAKHTRPVSKIALSHDSTFLLSCSMNGEILMWRTSSGEFVSSFYVAKTEMREILNGWISPILEIGVNDSQTGGAVDQGLSMFVAGENYCFNIVPDQQNSRYDLAVLAIFRATNFPQSGKSIPLGQDFRPLHKKRVDAPQHQYATNNSLYLTEDELTSTVDSKRVIASFQLWPAREDQINPLERQASGCNLIIEQRWVKWRGKAILWIPLDFRPDCMSFHNDAAIAMGRDDGTVTFIRILDQDANRSFSNFT